MRSILPAEPSIALHYVFPVYDVPIYGSRRVADEANGRAYLSIGHGLRDESERSVVSHRWADRQGELVWMSLYFSVGVWVSISLIHAPALQSGATARRGGPRLALARRSLDSK